MAMARSIDRREFIKGTVVLGAGVAVFPRAALSRPSASAGSWLAGDLHCHTVFSHDVWSGPGDENTDMNEAYTAGWTPEEQITIAASRGLDYLAITDHDDVRALSDPAYGASPIIMVPGYEHSLSRGHAGCLGVTQAFDKNTYPTSTDAGAAALRDAVRAAGGLFILNHPFYGSGWRYSSSVRPDSIEVWNIAWPYRHVADNVPSSPSVSDNYKSLPYWETEFLSSGKMPASGGSDNHWRSTVAVQGVGQPTTWVYAADRTWQSILDGIRGGRTTVSAEPPAMGGARIFLTATDGNEEWMIGDDIPSNAGTVRVTTRVVGAPGQSLRLVADGAALPTVLIDRPDFTRTFDIDASAHRRIRAEVFIEEGYWMSALTSPLYFA